MLVPFRILPILLLATAPVAPAAPAPTFEVAGPGAATTRVATLAEALTAARHLHAEGGATVVLTFPPGLLRLDAPITLDARDSGTVLRAAPEGTTLSGAEIVAPAGTLHVADPRARTLPPYRFGAHEPTPAPLLFAGDRPLRPASWPATGYRQDWRVEQTPAGSLLRPAAGTLPAISGPVLVSGYFGPGWAWDAIAATPSAGGLLLARTPEFGIAAAPRLRISGALLPAPDRFAPDATGAVLGAPASAPVELAKVATLLAIDHASNIRIEGLTFERSAGTAIRIEESSDVRLVACAVRQAGLLGIEVTGGRGVTIDRCRIGETGGTAVFLSGGGRARLEPSGHAITASAISDFAREVPTAPGLVVWGVGTLVRGNRIAGGGGPAVALQGNDHRIDGNEIAWIVCEAEDAGAIYFGRDWTQRGIVIADNYLHDVGGGRKIQAAGVYLDDFASGATVTRNAFFHMPFGVILGGGRDNRIEANLFAILTDAAVSFDARGTTWGKAMLAPGGPLLTRLAQMPYREALWRGRYPALAALPEDRPAEPVGNAVTANRRIDSQAVWSLTPGYSLVPEADRALWPGRPDRDLLDAPDRERAYPLLARLAALDPAPPWRTVRPAASACPR